MPRVHWGGPGEGYKGPGVERPNDRCVVLDDVVHPNTSVEQQPHTDDGRKHDADGGRAVALDGEEADEDGDGDTDDFGVVDAVHHPLDTLHC